MYSSQFLWIIKGNRLGPLVQHSPRIHMADMFRYEITCSIKSSVYVSVWSGSCIVNVSTFYMNIHQIHALSLVHSDKCRPGLKQSEAKVATTLLVRCTHGSIYAYRCSGTHLHMCIVLGVLRDCCCKWNHQSGTIVFTAVITETAKHTRAYCK